VVFIRLDKGPRFHRLSYGSNACSLRTGSGQTNFGVDATPGPGAESLPERARQGYEKGEGGNPANMAAVSHCPRWASTRCIRPCPEHGLVGDDQA
jgi:hypothetical protein